MNGKKIDRIVVKVGSSTLTHDGGKLNLQNFEKLTRVLSDIVNSGVEVILVSSGAIAAGMGKLGLKERPRELRLEQATAAVGQVALMYIYEKLFGEYGHSVGQILLSREDVDKENRRGNLVNTFSALLELGVVPVVNENDSVNVDEIIIGENDTLSAIVAELTNADILVLLTDIDGLYDADPHKNADAKLIPVVTDIEAVEVLAGGTGTSRGKGGMQTKLHAAKIAAGHGIDTVVANGADPSVLYSVVEGKLVGTLFVSAPVNREAGQKQPE
jgi:glutamate 5-kinase